MSLFAKNIKKQIIMSFMIVLIFLSSISYNSNLQNVGASLSPESSDEKKKFITQESPVSSDYSFDSYTPITNISNSGSDFVAHDHINVEHEFSLNFSYDDTEDSFVTNYTISPIIDYEAEFLNYGITEIRAKRDNYPIEEMFDDEQILIGTVWGIAQGFEVPWSNASFYGAYLNLDNDAGIGNLGSNVLELLLVKANELTGKPNMTEVISTDVNDPYSIANPLPALGITTYYDFTDVTLEQGNYFIVANLTSADAASQRQFVWNGHSESSDSGGPTYHMDPSQTWSSEIEFDYTMIVDMMPSDGLGSALVFTDLAEITLTDNSTSINSFLDPISGTGLHNMMSDTSIEIDFTNTYTFFEDLSATYTYSAFNSTYDSYSIFWNFTWNVGVVDYSPYTNLNRSQLLFVPTDWSDSPTAQNSSLPLSQIIMATGSNHAGYEFFLGDSSGADTFYLQTSSPNYVQSLTLSDDSGPNDEFTLGYWTNDGLIAYGHEGDTIYSSTTIKNLEQTGELNFTLYNPDGNIISLKTGLDANLSYVDISDYNQIGITSFSGFYDSSITLDPSVYGTDPVGYWTAFVFWQNGSEVGIYATRISVQSSIIFNASWETIPANDIWTSEDSQTILRKNGDSLNVKASYFSNSEPFFTEFGTPLENASIGYLTSWGLEGYLNEYPAEFSGAVPIYTTAGTRTITLTVNDTWSIQEMLEIDVEIFNEFTIEPDELNVETSNSEEVVLGFTMINETDPAKNKMYPDDPDEIVVRINTIEVDSSFYNITYLSGDVNITVDLARFGISSGNASISLEVSKANFKSSYTEDSILLTYSVEITAGSDVPFPTYAIVAIAASIFVVIVAIAITATIISSRKSPQQIMDIHDKSKVVGLLESVLALKKILILHTETSLPVFEMDIGEKSSVESTLVSGFLAALTQMGKTISGTEAGEIRKLQYRNFVVSSAKSETYTIYLFSTDDIIKEVQVKLFDVIMWFDYSFQIQDAIWDGRVDMFQQKKNLIKDKLADSLYVWLYFPLKFNQSKTNEIKKLEKNELKLALFMKKRGEARVSEIITKYQDSSIEETLTSVFQLLNKGFLERSQFSSYKTP